MKACSARRNCKKNDFKKNIITDKSAIKIFWLRIGVSKKIIK